MHVASRDPSPKTEWLLDNQLPILILKKGRIKLDLTPSSPNAKTDLHRTVSAWDGLTTVTGSAETVDGFKAKEMLFYYRGYGILWLISGILFFCFVFCFFLKKVAVFFFLKKVLLKKKKKKKKKKIRIVRKKKQQKNSRILSHRGALTMEENLSLYI